MTRSSHAGLPDPVELYTAEGAAASVPEGCGVFVAASHTCWGTSEVADGRVIREAIVAALVVIYIIII